MLFSHLAFVASVALAEIVELKPADFKPESMPGTWVVKFFSPYCGGCKTYAPLYEESESKARSRDLPFTFAAVNCIENGDLCTQQKINGWPALKVYQNGKFVDDAKVNRESTDYLVNFLVERSTDDSSSKTPSDALDGVPVGIAAASIDPSPTNAKDAVNAPLKVATVVEDAAKSPATAIESSSVIREIKDLSPETLSGLHVVKFYSPYCGHCTEFAPIYERIANQLPDSKFDAINCIENGDLCKAAGIKGWPELRIYRDGKLESQYNDNDFTYKTISKHLKQFGLDVKAPKAPPAEESASATHADSATESRSTADITGNKQDSTKTESKDFVPESLPAPIWTEPIVVTKADGTSHAFNKVSFGETVIEGGEPWLVKFYHPQCPHCRAMAPEWEKYAVASKGKMNVGEVSCEDNNDLCAEQGVKAYPSVFFFIKGEKHTYNGDFTVTGFQNFDRVQTGAQVLQVSSLHDLDAIIDSNVQDGMGTFVYLYDESVTSEDWDALGAQAKHFPDIQSVILHTSSSEIRKDAGIDTQGPALVYVSKAEDSTGATTRFHHVYPSYNSPELLRDVDSVVEWADSARLASPIHLETSEVPHLSRNADITVVKLLPPDEGPPQDLRKASKTAYTEALARQNRNQDSLREQRAEMYDDLKMRGKPSIANSVVKTPIRSPFVSDRSFAFITAEDWQLVFSGYIDTTKHEENQLLVVDWYNGRLMDNINGKPIILDNVDKAVDTLRNRKSSEPKKFKRNFKKLPKAYRPVVVFKPNLNLGQNIQTMEKKHLSFSGVVLAVLVFFCLKPIVRVAIARWRRSSSGPIITGKMD